MNKETAKDYLLKFIKLKWSMSEFGDTNWWYGESPEKDYTVHVILEDDEYLDNSEWEGRVRIWQTGTGFQVEVPALDKLNLTELDILSLKCRKCGTMCGSKKQMKLVNFDEGVCNSCHKTMRV